MKAKIREILWLCVALLCFFFYIYESYKHGFGSSYMFLVFTIFASVIYFIRLRMRKNERPKP